MNAISYPNMNVMVWSMLIGLIYFVCHSTMAFEQSWMVLCNILDFVVSQTKPSCQGACLSVVVARCIAARGIQCNSLLHHMLTTVWHIQCLRVCNSCTVASFHRIELSKCDSADRRQKHDVEGCWTECYEKHCDVWWVMSVLNYGKGVWSDLLNEVVWKMSHFRQVWLLPLVKVMVYFDDVVRRRHFRYT